MAFIGYLVELDYPTHHIYPAVWAVNVIFDVMIIFNMACIISEKVNHIACGQCARDPTLSDMRVYQMSCLVSQNKGSFL